MELSQLDINYHLLICFLLALDTDAQVNQFINTVYSPVNLNSTMYKYEKVQMKHVYNVVCRYTDLYADKNLNSFTAGCTYKTIDFMNVASKRRMCNGKRISERDLYVLKPTYHGKLLFFSLHSHLLTRYIFNTYSLFG